MQLVLLQSKVTNSSSSAIESTIQILVYHHDIATFLEIRSCHVYFGMPCIFSTISYDFIAAFITALPTLLHPIYATFLCSLWQALILIYACLVAFDPLHCKGFHKVWNRESQLLIPLQM